MKSTYHFDKSFEWNYENGPDYDGEFPQIEDSLDYSLLGFPLNSPIGISAGILMNSQWVSLYSKLGCDILTYKTVRSRERKSYPPPNWVFLECDCPLEPNTDFPLISSPVPRRPFDRLTSSICLGMPSVAPEVWREDVAKAKESIKKGQVLIVSVVGTSENAAGNHTPHILDTLAKDYAQCAVWAVESGADMIEANISCPNVTTVEGQIYHNRDSTVKIIEQIRESIPDLVPLILKIGHLQNVEDYEQFLQWVQPYAQGISLVNCIRRYIQTPNGAPTFGPGNEYAGVLGWGTFQMSLIALRRLIQAQNNLNTQLAILACGGVMNLKKALMLRDAGANAIMMGGAPALRPTLGHEIKQGLWEKSN